MLSFYLIPDILPFGECHIISMNKNITYTKPNLIPAPSILPAESQATHSKLPRANRHISRRTLDLCNDLFQGIYRNLHRQEHLTLSEFILFRNLEYLTHFY